MIRALRVNKILRPLTISPMMLSNPVVRFLAFMLTSFVAVTSSLSASPDAGVSTNVLWYAAPAAKWEEALPVGNGRLGAMIFGSTDKERLQLAPGGGYAATLSRKH